MKFLICYNQILEITPEKRLIFFAQQPPKGQKQGGKGTTTTKTTTKELTPAESNQQLAADIAKVKLEELPDEAPAGKDKKEKSGTSDTEKIEALYKDGKIEGECLRELSELIKDPNAMKHKECRYFVRALALGHIPGKAKYILGFIESLNSLEKDGEEQKHLEKLFRKFSDPSAGPMTQGTVEKELAKLPALKEKDIAEHTFTSTASRSGILATSAVVHNALEEASHTEEKIKAWKLEKLPEEVVLKLNRIMKDQSNLALRVNSEYDQIEPKEQELKEELQKPKRKRSQATLTRLQLAISGARNRIQQLHKQIDQLSLQAREPKLKEVEFLQRALSQRRALDKIATESGLDITDKQRLKIWAMDLARGADASSLELQGFSADRTGKAGKTQGSITIKAIEFLTDEEPPENNQDRQFVPIIKGIKEHQRVSPGKLVITYVDEQGHESKDDLKDFMSLVNGAEAYSEIDSFEELNDKLSDEMGGADLKEGMELECKVLAEMDDDNNRNYEIHKISIAQIDHKKKTITLNAPITKIPRQRMALSIHPGLYFDRIQKEFSFGEFAKIVKQHEYKKKISVEEIPKALEKAKMRLTKVTDSYGEDISEPQVKAAYEAIREKAPEFTPPNKPGESKEFFILDDDGQLRKLKVTFDPSDPENPYEIDEIALQIPSKRPYPGKPGPDINELIAAGLPPRMAFARQAKARNQKYVKKKMGTRELVNLTNGGNIANMMPPNKTFANDFVPPVVEVPVNVEAQTEAGKSEKPKTTKPNYYEEALAYDQIHKVGGMLQGESNYLKEVWTKTRFLSGGDIWEMGKAMWEYYDRRFQRRQKDRYSSIGTELPFFAPEMRRVNQATETEQVNQFKESFEQKGVFEIWSRLNTTHNRDEMKACFIVLSSKGQIRWDDIDVWRNLNRFTGSDKFIPIPTNGDPYTLVEETGEGEIPKTGFDFLGPAIDSLWGEGQYNDWYSQNKSTFQSNAKKFYEEGKELEGIEGGHERRLGSLLKKHLAGDFVDAQEYEGLILHAIENGKNSIQTKVYYMIQGVTKQNKDGRTIMPFDRIAHINSEMLPRFPILQYMTDPVPRPPDGKQSHRWTLDDYKSWAKMFDGGDPTNCAPNSNVDKFLWTYVIPSSNTQERINKALRNGENIDHDDMYAYIPPATEEVLTDACKATVGTKKFLTIEGYCNAFPGFSQYIRSCAETDKRTKLREAIKSYVRFEGIMTDRFEKEKDYQRIKSNMLNTPTVVSTTPPRAFIDQLNVNVKKIVEAYIQSTNDAELIEVYKWMYVETPNIKVSRSEQETQKKVDWALTRFGDVFDRVVSSDKGETMVSVMSSANLTGMGYRVSDAEKARRKAQFADALALE